MKQILKFFSLFLLFSCQNKEELTTIQSRKSDTIYVGSPSYQFQKEFEDVNLIRELSERVTVKGDSIAFKHLQSIYIFSGHEDEFFFYSYIMAIKFEYPEAYYQNYSILKTDIKDDDFRERNAHANYYLLKAYESGYRDAIIEVEERFDTKNLPKSSDYWNKLNEIAVD